jgi:hypothetical protein
VRLEFSDQFLVAGIRFARRYWRIGDKPDLKQVSACRFLVAKRGKGSRPDPDPVGVPVISHSLSVIRALAITSLLKSDLQPLLP